MEDLERILWHFCDDKKVEKFYTWLAKRYDWKIIEKLRSDVNKFRDTVIEYMDFCERKS